MKRILACLATLAALTQIQTNAQDVTPSILRSGQSLVVAFTVPEDAKLFSESVTAEAKLPDGTTVALEHDGLPAHVTLEDGIDYYTNSVSINFSLPDSAAGTSAAIVGWQACMGDICLMPQKRELNFEAANGADLVPGAVAPEPQAADIPTGLVLSRKIEGDTGAEDFLKFLSTDVQDSRNPLEKASERGGILLLVLAVVGGGLLLNLTPCVLPLIPVNLAILGISTQNSSRRQGVAIGSFFGLGIALAFGALGIISTLTGAVFGTLQSSPIFNASIAIVFCVLSLAMLGVISIDFSRLRGRFSKTPSGDGDPAAKSSPGLRYAGAFAAGMGSALLSGACVAPVLIWTLVMSATLVKDGVAAGAFLPLLLGVGMALPWPFLGGGVSTLPRPGKWMNIVKYLFAAIFLGFAAHYAFIAIKMLLPESGDDVSGKSSSVWLTDEASMLEAHAANGKPMLVYLTADWCTACRKMERTTFRDEKVLEAMEGFNAAKLDCTNLDSPSVKATIERYGALGFPFFAIIEAGNSKE